MSIFPNRCYLSGRLHHRVLPGGPIEDEQHHSEARTLPDFQQGEENSWSPQEQQVWSECVFIICDVFWLVICGWMSTPTPSEWERVMKLELVVQGWLGTSKKFNQNNRIKVRYDPQNSLFPLCCCFFFNLPPLLAFTSLHLLNNERIKPDYNKKLKSIAHTILNYPRDSIILRDVLSRYCGLYVTGFLSIGQRGV